VPHQNAGDFSVPCLNAGDFWLFPVQCHLQLVESLFEAEGVIGDLKRRSKTELPSNNNGRNSLQGALRVTCKEPQRPLTRVPRVHAPGALGDFSLGISGSSEALGIYSQEL